MEVGKGSLLGDLLRRYWQPVGAVVALDDAPVQRVKILGEELTLFRDGAGDVGLVGPRCAHRAVSLATGIPEENGLRCSYHGWCYDRTGQCVEMPLEPPGSRLMSLIKIAAYPATELGGLIWTYMGPPPAPPLPRWDVFVSENFARDVLVVERAQDWLASYARLPKADRFVSTSPAEGGSPDGMSQSIAPNAVVVQPSDSSIVTVFCVPVDDERTLEWRYRISPRLEGTTSSDAKSTFVVAPFDEERGGPAFPSSADQEFGEWTARPEVDTDVLNKALEEQCRRIDRGDEQFVGIDLDADMIELFPAIPWATSQHEELSADEHGIFLKGEGGLATELSKRVDRARQLRAADPD